jgi:uncharacterized protein (DUF58 family)
MALQHYKRWFFGFSSIFLVLVAVITSQSDLFVMAAFFYILPLISYIIGMLSLRKIEVFRDHPSVGWEGEVITVRYLLKSHSRFPHFMLSISDPFPEEFKRMDVSNELLCVFSKGTAKQSINVELNLRGDYSLEWLSLNAMDPLGLFRFTKRKRVRSEILVYPTPYNVPLFTMMQEDQFGLQTRKHHFSLYAGDIPDGLREYIPGDPLRRIHWKSSAKMQKPYVMEFEECVGHNLIILPDLNPDYHVGHGKQSTTEYIVHLAASYTREAIRQNYAVRLLTPDLNNPANQMSRGNLHMMNILTQLAHLQPGPNTQLNQNVVKLLGRTSSDLTMIAITAYPNYNLAEALGYFARMGVEARLIYVNPMSFQTNAQVDGSLSHFGSECMSRYIEFQVLSKSEVAPTPSPWDKTAEYVTNG